MRLATLHRPNGTTLLVNPNLVLSLRETEDGEDGNCVVVFADGYDECVVENLAAAAAMIEGPHGHSERSD